MFNEYFGLRKEVQVEKKKWARCIDAVDVDHKDK
jgi:N-acyl-L-homoserine lactone synthetase